MEHTTSFGYWIRRQRKALDLTQRALAERVGCSLAEIKKIEQDERRPSRQIAELLADVLGVPASQREIFLDVARGIRSVDQLLLVQEPVVSALPTGIVTFLFTDIEESTKLAQEHAEEWEELRARHHMNLHETMGAHSPVSLVAKKKSRMSSTCSKRRASSPSPGPVERARRD